MYCPDCGETMLSKWTQISLNRNDSHTYTCPTCNRIIKACPLCDSPMSELQKNQAFSRFTCDKCTHTYLGQPTYMQAPTPITSSEPPEIHPHPSFVDTFSLTKDAIRDAAEATLKQQLDNWLIDDNSKWLPKAQYYKQPEATGTQPEATTTNLLPQELLCPDCQNKMYQLHYALDKPANALVLYCSHCKKKHYVTKIGDRTLGKQAQYRTMSSTNPPTIPQLKTLALLQTMVYIPFCATKSEAWFIINKNIWRLRGLEEPPKPPEPLEPPEKPQFTFKLSELKPTLD